jgi:hypothetical protein
MEPRLRARCCGCTGAFQASRAGSIPVARSESSHGVGSGCWPRGVAQSGSAPGWGPGGRRFKSCLPDRTKNPDTSGHVRPAQAIRPASTGNTPGQHRTRPASTGHDLQGFRGESPSARGILGGCVCCDRGITEWGDYGVSVETFDPLAYTHFLRSKAQIASSAGFLALVVASRPGVRGLGGAPAGGRVPRSVRACPFVGAGAAI